MTEPGGQTQGLDALELQPFPHWSFSSPGLEVRFVGRVPGEPAPQVECVLAALEGAPERLGWLRQRHSATARVARDGPCGEGDGLWTAEPGLALCIVTADCVPIVCGSQRRLAAIHAGWRGLVSGVVEATIDSLEGSVGELEAWLGPAIGSCCYEVGEDVAAKVSASVSKNVTVHGGTGRPHLDLHRAAEDQLRSLGVGRVNKVNACTKCHPDLLWSYRASPGENGRNHALAWLQS